MWSDHLVQLDGMVAGIQAAALGHTAGRIRIRAAQRRGVPRHSSEEAADRFVRELLTVGVSEDEARPVP